MKKLLCGVLVLGLFLIGGCSSVKNITGKFQQQTPENTLTNYFTAAKKLDTATMAKLSISDTVSSPSSSSSSSSNSNDYTKELFEKLDVTQEEKAQINGDSASIKVKITAPDMKKIMSNEITSALSSAMANAFSSNESSSQDTSSQMDKDIKDALSKSDVALATTEMDVQLVKSNNQWKVKVTDNLSDAMSGGFISLMKSISSSTNSSSSN